MRKQTAIGASLAAAAVLAVSGCAAMQSIADTKPPVHVIIGEKHQHADGNYYSQWVTTKPAANPGDTLTCVFDIDNQTDEQLIVNLATSSTFVEKTSENSGEALAKQPEIAMEQPIHLGPGEMDKGYTFEVTVPAPSPDKEYNPDRTEADCNLSVTATPASES